MKRKIIQPEISRPEDEGQNAELRHLTSAALNSIQDLARRALLTLESEHRATMDAEGSDREQMTGFAPGTAGQRISATMYSRMMATSSSQKMDRPQRKPAEKIVKAGRSIMELFGGRLRTRNTVFLPENDGNDQPVLLIQAVRDAISGIYYAFASSTEPGNLEKSGNRAFFEKISKERNGEYLTTEVRELIAYISKKASNVTVKNAIPRIDDANLPPSVDMDREGIKTLILSTIEQTGCFQHTPEVREKYRLSKRTVQEILNGMVAEGLIARRGISGRDQFFVLK